MATPTESRLDPSTNGDLEDRVKQLRLDDQLGAGKGRSGGSWLPWVLCALLAITWVGVGVRWYKSTPSDAPGGPTTNPGGSSGAPQPTGGGTVEAGAMVTQLKGIVIPSLQVNLSPRDVAAEITEINFFEGKRVKKGDKLATLLDLQYSNRLKSEEAAVESAKAQLKRSEAALVAAKAKVAKAEAALAASKASVADAVAMMDKARKDFDQAKMQNTTGTISALEYQMYEAAKLSADAKKVVTDANVVAAEREIEATKADVDTAVASVTAARSDLTAAEARRDEAKRLVDNCIVTAPIDGTILTKVADKGALVSPMSFNVAAGICTIADLSKLEVEIDVPERQVTRVRPGQVVKLQADADPTREYRGVVDRVMPIADDTKNVVKVRIRAYLGKNEPQGSFLKPKMGITATVYETKFGFDPEKKDFAWGDEDGPTGRKVAWEAEWPKKDK